MKRLARTLAGALLLASLAFPFIASPVAAEAIPSWCSTALPRVTIYESNNQTGDWATFCTNISDLNLIAHSQAGDCARSQFDPEGNDWNNCANSIKVWLPYANSCLRLWNTSDYNFAMVTFRGPRTAASLDISDDVLSSFNFFRDQTLPYNCI